MEAGRGSWLSSLALASVLGPGMPGCGGSISGLCNDICDCEGCSDRELDDCIDNLEDAEREVENEGCDEEFDALLSCSSDEGECHGDDYSSDGCGPEEEDLAECLDGGVVVGVGDPCARAVALLQACPGVGEGEPPAQCEGAVRCQSQCVVNEGDNICAAIAGSDAEASQRVNACFAAC